jgi:hypothetical protein
MNANLIATACFQPHLNYGGLVQVRHHAKMRDCKLADRFVVGRKTVQILVSRQ